MNKILKYNKFNESSVDNSLPIIESILDDYLDGIGHIFTFTLNPRPRAATPYEILRSAANSPERYKNEKKPNREDIFLIISGSFIEKMHASSLPKNCPCQIITCLNRYYNTGSTLGLTINDINNTPPLQRIDKLTGFRLTYFSRYRTPTQDLQIILELSKNYETPFK